MNPVGLVLFAVPVHLLICWHYRRRGLHIGDEHYSIHRKTNTSTFLHTNWFTNIRTRPHPLFKWLPLVYWWYDPLQADVLHSLLWCNSNSPIKLISNRLWTIPLRKATERSSKSPIQCFANKPICLKPPDSVYHAKYTSHLDNIIIQIVCVCLLVWTGNIALIQLSVQI